MRDIARWSSTNGAIAYFWARGKRSGFSPGAAARHSQLARVHEDKNQPENPFSPRKNRAEPGELSLGSLGTPYLGRLDPICARTARICSAQRAQNGPLRFGVTILRRFLGGKKIRVEPQPEFSGEKEWLGRLNSNVGKRP